ncbi:hybrid sensor histidine kinase/response regulator [Aphanothece hegewaldii CCALA 016]|uniref:Circadian input-output histidine kinase CikA n=1 Tax=Aphanothece hegewaldii CCALA 016 TaxID=2107694 RepID=A0A2T1LVE5_9CHRO|nr:response regulator [Aphanothece hegewaldii]PSF35693.1 hybrid sensor histidine kinase/response regulator [Aphanothece hegewaldii CCALA 016]
MSQLVIICVDDEKSILDSLQIELEAALGDKYLIELAQSAQEAEEVILELVAEHYEIALIIADYIMPGIKGDELLIRIHEQYPKTVKIMLTGQADITAIANVINKANLYRYLTKPWQAEDLILTVKEGIYRYCQAQQQATLIAELHESKNQLKQFLEAVPIGIFITDAQGKPYYLNHMGQSITNTDVPPDITLERLLENYQAYLAGSEQIYPLEKTPIWKALHGESITIDDMELRTNDRIIPVEARGTPIYDQDGKIIHAIVAFQDISERKQAQKVLSDYNRTLEIQISERTEALQEALRTAETANKAKSAFLAHMSHELRTPLNAILGFAQLMERETSLTSRQQEFLATINRSGEHLLNLINDVLEMSKIEAGRTIVHPVAFDLHRLLQTLQEMFQIRAQAKQIFLQFQIATDLPQYIITDEGKLRQVLINLLSNAVKFTQKGEIILRVIWGKPKTTEKDIKLFFEIEDTGVGISSEEMKNLFQPFVQTKSGIHAKEGTGLGLAISRQFVQLMGGNIRINSIFGKGSSFRFDVTAKLADASMIMIPSAQRVLQIAPEQPQYRILIVDDQLENCNLIAQLLDSVGFETRTACNGEIALTIWQTWQPALIWMDMRMPVLDGYEATRRIRQLESQSHTFIIALTASTFDEQQSECLAIGCDDFVGKPFREQDIFDKMNQYLGVRYIYAEPTTSVLSLTSHCQLKGETLKASDLAIMPIIWREQLHQAATRVNAKLLNQLIQQIPQENNNLAEALTELTRQFRFDLIVELTQSKNE